VNILVTGGSRGIGRAIAHALAARGACIALHYRADRAAAESALAALPGEGHALFAAELGEADAVAELWRAASERFGRIDVLVNNAGIYEYHPPLETSPADWRRAWERTLAINLLGPASLCLLAGQAMAAAGGGRIVNLSSRGAFRGEPRAPAYGASKAGLNSLSQSLAQALAPRQVYVFCLAPGWTETEMAAPILSGPRAEEILAQQPLGRVARPEEIARAAVFCALDAPAAMTGSIIDLNGASYLRT
jgi:NAD(P)-dependent dehydrogenase (short-subunit alcohol dehydrogenase family)